MRKRLESLDASWSYQRRPATVQVPAAPAADESIEVILNPWNLSFDPALSLKGKSKMVNILKCTLDFLEKPYNSADNPIHITFPSACNEVGGAIGDFAVGHSIGFAKSLAQKLLLLSIVKLELCDEELRAIQAHAKACFHFRCTFKSAGSTRADRFQCLRDKFGEASRPRPDPIQVCGTLLAQCCEDGLAWSSAAGGLIKEFNEGTSNEDRKLSDLEAAIVRVWPTLDEDTQATIDYHWQNYKASKSALPYSVLSAESFLSGAKPKKGMESEVWKAILAADNRKRHWYVKRKVGFFAFKVADAKRLKKKLNLQTGAANLRPQEDAATGHLALPAYYFCSGHHCPWGVLSFSCCALPPLLPFFIKNLSVKQATKAGLWQPFSRTFCQRGPQCSPSQTWTPCARSLRGATSTLSSLRSTES